MNGIVTKKGAKQVEDLISEKRGSIVTITIAINALRNSIPSMFVFSLFRYQNQEMDLFKQATILFGWKK